MRYLITNWNLECWDNLCCKDSRNRRQLSLLYSRFSRKVTQRTPSAAKAKMPQLSTTPPTNFSRHSRGEISFPPYEWFYNALLFCYLTPKLSTTRDLEKKIAQYKSHSPSLSTILPLLYLWDLRGNNFQVFFLYLCWRIF